MIHFLNKKNLNIHLKEYEKLLIEGNRYIYIYIYYLGLSMSNEQIKNYLALLNNVSTIDELEFSNFPS